MLTCNSVYACNVQLQASCYCNIILRIQQGVLCNSQCPDELRLGELTSNNWHMGIKIFISVLIIGLAVLCVVIKIVFILWLILLEKKQGNYLTSLDDELESTDNTMLPVQNVFERVTYICTIMSLHM